MSSTTIGSEMRFLFHQTKIRYPNQKFESETLEAWLQDWRAECKRVGWARFKEGVEGARANSEFFPLIAKIRKFIPEPRNENLRLQREMADLERRRADGERFYSLADVLMEFSRKVLAGEIKGRDDRGQIALETWAKKLRTDAKAFAEKMLATDDKKRSKSTLQLLGEMAKGAGA